MDPHRPALSGPVHVFLHGLIVVLGWVIFGWSWWTVALDQPLRTPLLALLIVITLILAPLITLYWVGHNREIYQRKGQRRGTRSITETYQQDWAGRRVHAQFDSLRHAPMVIINSTAEDKYFMAHTHPSTSKSEH